MADLRMRFPRRLLAGFLASACGLAHAGVMVIDGVSEQDIAELRSRTGQQIEAVGDAWVAPEASGLLQRYRIDRFVKRHYGEIVHWAADASTLMSPVAQGDLPAGVRRQLDDFREYGESRVSVVRLAPRVLRNYALTTGFPVSGFPVPPAAPERLSERGFRLQLADGRDLVLMPDAVTESKQGVVWRGHTDRGSAFLSETTEGLVGTIREDDRAYTILPAGGGLYTVSEVTTRDRLAPEHPPRELSPADRDNTTRDAPAPSPLQPGDDVVIDVLVVYSDRVARLGTAGPDALINLLVAETNETFRASGLQGVRLNIVHAYQGNFSESVGWPKYVPLLAGEHDGFLDDVHAERDKYNADVVVMLVRNAQYCGEAADIFAADNTAFLAISVVTSCSTLNYSLAHEMGHLLGARHDWGVDSADKPFGFAHGYVAPDRNRRTLMAYPDACDYCLREGLWSSPELRFSDHQPAGEPLRAFDARVVRDYARYISEFR